MKAEEVLPRLEKARRSGRGFTALCPAHSDGHPSLSIREGDRGILIRCWAGCSIESVCRALGIRPRDLFYDERPDPRRNAETRSRRGMENARFRLGMKKAATLQEAGAVIEAATGVDVSKWTPEELDRAMQAVSKAHEILWEEGF